MAVNHGTSSMQIRVTGAFIRPIKSPIKPSSVREDGLLPCIYTRPCVAQPPTEDKSSTPPRGCREFSLPVSYPETWRNRSTYCLELIFPPSLFPPIFLRSWKLSTLIPANFLLTLHFLFFPSLFLFLFPLRSRSVYFRSRPCTSLPLERLGFQEKRRGWRPGDEWWREFGKRGQVARPGLINGVDRIAC